MPAHASKYVYFCNFVVYIYRLFVWFHLSSLRLSGFLDVVSRQPSNGGGILVVRPQLTELLLAVQP